MHKRDGNTKNNPHKWAFFGGGNEGGETPGDCCVRELMEELHVEIDSSDLVPVCDYLNIEKNTWRYIYYIESELKKSEINLGEGADFDWISLDKVFEYDLTEKVREDLKTFLQLKNKVTKKA